MALMRHAVPVAQADRRTGSTESWDNARTRTAVVAESERNAYRLRGAKQEIKALSGGKDVFEVAGTPARQWPALGAGNQGRGRLTPAGDRRLM